MPGLPTCRFANSAKSRLGLSPSQPMSAAYAGGGELRSTLDLLVQFVRCAGDHGAGRSLTVATTAPGFESCARRPCEARISVLTPLPDVRPAPFELSCAWGFEYLRTEGRAKAKILSRRPTKVPVLDSGARGATTPLSNAASGCAINWEKNPAGPKSSAPTG